MSFLRSLAAVVAALALFAAPVCAAPDLGPELPDEVRLNTSVTVSGAAVRLGDVFSGLTYYKDKVVKSAPRPGQRDVLNAEFLANLARTYGFDWQPKDAFDRAVVFRPGQTVSSADMLATLKADLVLKGLPGNFGLIPTNPLPTLTAPAEAMSPILVRQAFYDSASKTFGTVLEIAGADDAPQILQIRGTAVATVSVPVLTQDAGRTTVITRDMIEQIDLPETQVRRDIITEAALLIGMSPRAFLTAHRPIRDSEVARVTLVDVPVLRSEMRRDGVIKGSDIIWTTVNAANLTPDVVLGEDYLIGKSPRGLVAGGAPIRRGDVIAVRQVQMAVAARDLVNGAPLQEGDINWVPTTDNEISVGVVTNAALVKGRALTRPIRAGQALRTIDLVRPTVVTRGKLVTIIYTSGPMRLTVQGQAMEDGALSQAIRVTNAKSKRDVLAEVVDANTVRVTSQQSAMQ